MERTRCAAALGVVICVLGCEVGSGGTGPGAGDAAALDASDVSPSAADGEVGYAEDLEVMSRSEDLGLEVGWDYGVPWDRARDEAWMCTAWQEQLCRIYHACGMMQAVGDCSEHAAAMCPAGPADPAPPADCDTHTVAELDQCLRDLTEAGCGDLIFETIHETPSCLEFEACFGWPM